MGLNEPETSTQQIAHEEKSVPPPPAVAAEHAAPLDPIELESLALNLEASQRIYTEHHFFGWTQGLLQNLIRHEVLVCCLRKGEADTSIVDSYSTAHTEPKLFSHLYRQDAALADKFVRAWEAAHFRPVTHDAESEAPFSGSALARELSRIGATKVVTHGTFDTSGRMASFFVFACRTEDAGPRQVRLVGMLVPFLHSAWVSTKINPPAGSGESSVHTGRDLLTVREQEVLKWVYLGKSNIEIGLILGISPLTVKNHVQEILRRLNVQNRTQAVGKAFDLHILSS